MALDVKALRDGVITNVISMVVGAIVLGAGTIVWNENNSNKERIGYLVGEIVKLKKDLTKLRSEVYDVEATLINSNCYDSDDCTK